MLKLDIKTVLGMGLCDINKEFDNSLYNTALKIRKETANTLISSSDPFWESISIDGDMLTSVLERTPFPNTERVLKFNLAITEQACNRILEGNYSLVEKIGMYANVVEIGAREFISPDNTRIVYKNLSAAKERGYFFTPPSLAIRMVIASIKNAESLETIMDPASGVGVFLAYHILLNPEIKTAIGIEIDPRTVGLTKKLLHFVSEAVNRQVEVNIHCANFFDYFNSNKDMHTVDLIIMNPPYGAVKFLSSDLTDISTQANMSAEEISELENRLKRQTLEYASRLRSQFSGYGMEKGTLEYSKLFMAATLEMLSSDGILVAITPSSWLGDETSSEFRKKIVANGLLHEIWIIPEKAKMFKGVNQPTAVSVLGKQGSSKVSVLNPVLKVEDIDVTPELFGVSSIIAVSGEKMKFPKCSGTALRLLERLQEYGKIKNIESLVNMRGELDLTAFKKYISAEETTHRLVRGDHIQGSILVPSTSSDKAGYVLFDDFMKAIEASEKARFVYVKRIAIPQCSYLQKKHRIEAAIVPEEVVLGNSCNFITVKSDSIDPIQLFYYWMVMNSSITEWQFRIFSYNNHVANKELDELTCIPFENLPVHTIKEIEEMVFSGEGKDGFTIHQDAFMAALYELSLSEYNSILNDLDTDNIDAYLMEYKKMCTAAQPKNVPQHQMPSLSELDKVMISYVEPGGNWTSIPETVPSKRLDQIREMARTRGMVRTTYYSRLRYNQPAYTISTYYNRPGNGANIHPWEDRTLSSREAARLQSFPDSFIFEGSDAEVRTQIGNAVPPLLGYAIGTAIKKKTGYPLQFCDMFAGAGGLSFGMELAGYKGVAAIELNKSAAATFALNHCSAMQTIVGDINDAEIQSELFSAIDKGISKDTPWVLVGGPPCQGFSTAGYRDENDIRNKLVDSYLKIIQKTQPTIVVMENVPGILSMKKGDVIKGVYQSLHQLGYVFHQSPWVLDAERYGVPQMRKRVVIVAAKSNDFLPEYPTPIFEKCLGRREQSNYQMTFSLLPYPITVGEAFYGLPPLMAINEYYPKDAEIDQTYSKWCNGEISVEEMLNQRGTM